MRSDEPTFLVLSLGVCWAQFCSPSKVTLELGWVWLSQGPKRHVTSKGECLFGAFPSPSVSLARVASTSRLLLDSFTLDFPRTARHARAVREPAAALGRLACV